MFKSIRQWFATTQGSLIQKNRHRWWRILIISALIQLSLLVIAWHSWRTVRLSNPVSLQSAPVAPPNVALQTRAEAQTPNNTESKTETARKGAQPLHTPTPQTTRKSKQTDSEPLIATNNPVVQATTPTTPSSLWSLPIPLQKLSYSARISNGSWTQNLQTAHLSVTSLGEQRYEVRLSNKQLDTRNGNIGFYSAFIASDKGPEPSNIGGGAYLKTDDSPQGFALGALRFSSFNPASSRSNAYSHFLDRASLIIYIQGALMAKRIQPPQQLQLPIYGMGGVHMQTVQVSHDNPNNSPCHSCIRASVSGNLGEVKHWAVWYDSVREWKPVLMKLHFGKSSEWVLTLAIES